ncbi:unnamed protein product, partial [Cylicocyclus nassatus]
ETWVLFACLILVSCEGVENSSGGDGDVTRDKRDAHGDVATRKIRNSDRNGGDGDDDEGNAYRELLEKQNDMIMEDLREVLQVTERSTDFDDAQIDKLLMKAIKEKRKNANTSEEAALHDLFASILKEVALKQKQAKMTTRQ